jgi:nifR3 family TIM-barrel protein
MQTNPKDRHETHRAVPSARAGEFLPLRLGQLRVWPPVLLAPMAGVTNTAFREICRRFGAPLCVGEMVTAQPLVEGRSKTLRLAAFGPNEAPRSLQLYGADPYYVGEAVKRLVGEGLIDHLDLNFGCPVRKVTRKGGGAAIPAKPRLLERIVVTAVANAQCTPVTVKIRIGIDNRLPTFLAAGRIAEQAGCAAVGLHARTAAQLFAGPARWEAIGELKRAVGIPVLGNGDIWQAQDALRMMRQTGCDGVLVGRGCLGRPWLFRDLDDVFGGRSPQPLPRFGQVVPVMREHARLLAGWIGEREGLRAFRRHATWYTKGFRDSARLRQRLMQVHTLGQLADVLAQVDPALALPDCAMGLPRGRGSKMQRVRLPEGFLESLDLTAGQ